MVTCIVTGGAGFLGSHLCDELLARGNRVICVDNLETGSPSNIQHIRDPDRFVHLGIGIIEPYFVDEPVDFVYHLASPASPIDYLRLPLPTDDPKVRRPDISLARELLDWEPRVGLREGLERTINESGVERLVGQR